MLIKKHHRPYCAYSKKCGYQRNSKNDYHQCISRDTCNQKEYSLLELKERMRILNNEIY